VLVELVPAALGAAFQEWLHLRELQSRLTVSSYRRAVGSPHYAAAAVAIVIVSAAVTTWLFAGDLRWWQLLVIGAALPALARRLLAALFGGRRRTWWRIVLLAQNPGGADETRPSQDGGATAMLHWNTSLRHDDETWPEALTVGVEYDLTTTLATAPGWGRSVAIAASELPPGTEITFEVRAVGATLRAGGQRGTEVRSAPLLVTNAGTNPFHATLVPTSDAVTLSMDLCTRGALVARRTYEFGRARDADAPQGAAEDRAATASISQGSLETAPVDVRLDVEERDGEFILRVEVGGQRLAQRLLADRGRELKTAVVTLRKRLVALSNSYDPERPDEAFDAFKELGTEMHEALFGNPRDANVDDSLREAAKVIAEAGGSGARMQIVAETLPLPWAVLYDGNIAARERHDEQGFWGARFRIDRAPIVKKLKSPRPPVLRNGALRIQSCVNPHLDEDDGVTVVQAQRELFAGIARRRAGTAAQPVIDSRDAFERWLRKSPACEVLYFFCHAHAATTVHDTLLPKSERPALQAALGFGPGRDGGKIDVQAMRKARIETLPGEPFVFLNACSSAQGDTAFQSILLTHFVGTWRARGFLGTDWEIPTLFADEFGRRVLHLFLEERKTIADALEEAAQPYLAARNPLPLIYALYAQPELRAE
jgi:CHAT domain